MRQGKERKGRGRCEACVWVWWFDIFIIFFCCLKYLFELFPGNWERKRPIWAMLMVNGLTPSEIASRGFPVLDLYLAQLADQLKKLVRMVTFFKGGGKGAL